MKERTGRAAPRLGNFGRILLAIVAVALGIRVTYVAVAKRGPCAVERHGKVVGSYPSECVLGDQIFYNAEANAVAAGQGFVEPLWAVTHPGEKPPPAADHPPLTVFVLAGVNWAVEHPPLSAFAGDRFNSNVREDRYTMAVLGALLVLLIGLLGRRVGRGVAGPRAEVVGLVAAGIAAVSPNLWVNDGLVMSETITSVVVVAACLLAFALWDKPTWPRAAALGACCGLAALARVELVLFVPLLAVVVALSTRQTWSSRAVLAVVAVVASVVVIGPWVGYNLSRFHDPTFISTNDGIALAGSNCDAVYYGPSTGLTAITSPGACIDDPPPPGDQSQVAKIYRDRAFHYMSNHKRRLVVVVAARIGRTWGVFRPGDMVSFNEGEGREDWVSELGLAAYYPTLAVAIAGVVIFVRRRALRSLWVLLVPAITVTIGVAATYGQTRFRAAAESSLAILAAVGLVSLASLIGAVDRRRSRAA